MADLLIPVPSRGRPHNIARLVDTVKQTATGDVDILVILDDDDEQQYPRIDGVDYLVTGRLGLARSYNLALGRILEYPYAALLNDDHVPETPGWDQELIGEIDRMGGTGIAYGADGIQATLCTAPIVSTDIFRHLGWVSLPGLRHWYIDNVWYQLGLGLGRIIRRPDVVTRHHHRINGLAPDDATYREVSDNHELTDADRTRYTAWLTHDAPTVIADLAEALIIER